MLIKEEKQLSFYSLLYNKIPEQHLLKRIEKAVDFSFVNDLLKDSYCVDFGRPAKEPELMLKLLILQYLYNLSDVKVIEEASLNLAFLWFLGLNPEDELPDPSLLAKFRTQRLKDISLDDVLTEIVRQCVENGVIKSKEISVDATHMEANCTKQVPERIMKQLAKNIHKALELDNENIPEDIDTNIPDYKSIPDHKTAKETMKQYLEKIIADASKYDGEHTKTAIDEAKEVLSDEKFILQKGLRSLVDKEARVGRKSKNDDFFGYKVEFSMTTDERIITAVGVHSGEYVDGRDTEKLIDRTAAAGIDIEEFYGDKAYFRKDILEMLDDKGIKDYIPVSASVYKIDEELFSYNKDSDEWICIRGNRTVSCKKKIAGNGRGEKYDVLSYKFKKEDCMNCPYRDKCIGTKKNKNSAKILQVAASAPIFFEKSQFQKTDEFKEKYKKRSAQEWKNGEMKRFHGMAKARGWGQRSITTQAKLTAIAVNLKRIAALITEILPELSAVGAEFLLTFSLFSKIQKNSYSYALLK